MASNGIPEGKYVNIHKGYQIHYHDEGGGFPVIFLHGSGQGASCWSNFKQNSPYFVYHGFRSLLPDTLGFGYSSMPDNVQYTLDFMVDGTKALIDALGIKECALVGNSLGGAMALRLALQYPDLVKKLILMAPGGLEEKEAYFAMEGIKKMFAVIQSKGASRDALKEVFKLQLYDESLVTDALIDERYPIAVKQPGVIYSTMQVPNMKKDLHKLKCPILTFWGMDDKYMPLDGAITLAKCKNSRVVLQSECGHWFMVEYKNLFNKMCVDFLKE